MHIFLIDIIVIRDGTTAKAQKATTIGIGSNSSAKQIVGLLESSDRSDYIGSKSQYQS